MNSSVVHSNRDSSYEFRRFPDLGELNFWFQHFKYIEKNDKRCPAAPSVLLGVCTKNPLLAAPPFQTADRLLSKLICQHAKMFDQESFELNLHTNSILLLLRK